MAPSATGERLSFEFFSITFLIAVSLTGVTKLADANNAGTRNASQCTLILTEGDSAKALAVAGLGVVGRDHFGVFPLRGKLLNVREAKHDQIMKNEEIQNIKKIMGLQHNKEYSDVTSLRYGQLMIMTDQVRCCVPNSDRKKLNARVGSRRFAHQRTSHQLFGPLLPVLVEAPQLFGRVCDAHRPRKSDHHVSQSAFSDLHAQVTRGKQRIDFFTIPEYEQWLEETPDAHKWDSKYYKVCDPPHSHFFSALTAQFCRVSELARIRMPATTFLTWLSI